MIATRMAVVEDLEGFMNLEGERRLLSEILQHLDKVSKRRSKRRVAVLVSSAGEASHFALCVARHFGVNPDHCECFLRDGDMKECGECMDEYIGSFDLIVAIVAPGMANPLVEATSRRVGRPTRRTHYPGVPDLYSI